MATIEGSQKEGPTKFRVFSVFSGKILKLSDYSGRDDKVTSINEVTNPTIFCVFCVLSG